MITIIGHRAPLQTHTYIIRCFRFLF